MLLWSIGQSIKRKCNLDTEFKSDMMGNIPLCSFLNKVSDMEAKKVHKAKAFKTFCRSYLTILERNQQKLEKLILIFWMRSPNISMLSYITKSASCYNQQSQKLKFVMKTKAGNENMKIQLTLGPFLTNFQLKTPFRLLLL